METPFYSAKGTTSGFGVAILCLFAIACGEKVPADPPEIAECESYVISQLNTPSTYKRIGVFGYDDGG